MASKKKNGKRNTSSQNCNSKEIIFSTPISADELKRVIAEALVEAEELKTQKVREQKEQELRERWKVVKYKDYNDKPKSVRWLFRFCNDVNVVIRLCFIPKDRIKGDLVNSIFLKTMLGGIFGGGRFLFGIISLLLFAYIPAQYFIKQIPSTSWIVNVGVAVLSVILFLDSRMFRIASIEIKKSQDVNFIFGMLASLSSILSIIIAIIAIIVAG